MEKSTDAPRCITFKTQTITISRDVLVRALNCEIDPEVMERARRQLVAELEYDTLAKHYLNYKPRNP